MAWWQTNDRTSNSEPQTGRTTYNASIDYRALCRYRDHPGTARGLGMCLSMSHSLGTEFENQCSNNHPEYYGSEVMAYGQTISHLLPNCEGKVCWIKVLTWRKAHGVNF